MLMTSALFCHKDSADNFHTRIISFLRCVFMASGCLYLMDATQCHDPSQSEDSNPRYPTNERAPHYLNISPGSQPVLAVSVASVSPPEFPGEETLEGGVGLVHQRPSSLAAEALGLLEVPGLVVVENVTFPVVGGRAARPLVPGKYHRDQSTSHPIPPHSTRSWTTVESRLHMVT